MRLKLATGVLAILAMFALSARSAEAAPIALQLTDGTSTVTILDGGLGDLDGTDGLILFSGAVGQWRINVSTGLGTGPAGADYLHLNSVNTSPGTSSTLAIYFTQQDNTVAFPGFTFTFTPQVNGGTASAAAFYDNANGLFGGTQFAALGPFTTSGSASTTGAIQATAPYSLTQAFFITGNGGAVSFSADASLNPVPEPGSLLLLGGGLLGLAGMARRRLSRKKA